MKIAITINTAWNIYNFRRGLILALIKEGYEVVAISPNDQYIEQIEKLGCKHYTVTMDNKGTNPIKDFQLYRSLLKIYGEIKPDIVLQYTIKPNIYGTFAAKKLNIPVINNVSGLGTIFLHDSFIFKAARYLYKVAFKYPKTIFFQNKDDLALFEEKKLITKNNANTLPGSGVNTQEVQYLEIDDIQNFKFVVLARVIYDKGIQEYVDAVKFLKEKGYKFEALLAGALDETSKMGIPREVVMQWHEAGLIQYLGEVSNIQSLLQETHCAVLPSYREGTPKSLLEAGATGRPIVTTNVPGCKEVVIDQQNGYLCEAKDYKSLALAMEKMLNHTKQELIQLGKQSRNLIEEKFDEQIVIKKYIKAIKE